MYKNFQGITHTYKDHNEDRYGSSKHGAWVIDGALPLSHAHHSDAYSDVVWMVSWWQDYLYHHLDCLDLSIVEIMEGGVDQINEDFSVFCDVNNLSKLDRASASIAIVRVNGDTLENFVLGDVEINIKKQDESLVTLVDESMADMDDQVIHMIFNNPQRKNNLTFKGYTEDELKVLRANRMTMNAVGGYSVLEHDKAAMKNAIYKKWPKDQIKSVLIMSDGYSAIYNKYGLMTQEDLMETCSDHGLEGPLKDIRNVERKDPNFLTFKRLRQHDDASAVCFQL